MTPTESVVLLSDDIEFVINFNREKTHREDIGQRRMLVLEFMLMQLMSCSLLNQMDFIPVAVMFACFAKGLSVIAG